MALYTTPKDPEEFVRRYRAEHLPLARKMPGLEKCTIYRVMGDRVGAGEEGVWMVAALSFPDADTMKAAIRSPESKAASDALAGIAPGLATFYRLDQTDW
jgi:uncharacterized protein (TIGR02118 family)